MRGDNSTDADTNVFRGDNDTVTYNLTGLVPYSNYLVQVWAETSAGNGSEGLPLQGLQTLEDG